METVIVLFIYLSIIATDMRITLKKRDKRTNISYITIVSLTFIVLLLSSLDVEVPSPTLLIKSVVTSITK